MVRLFRGAINRTCQRKEGMDVMLRNGGGRLESNCLHYRDLAKSCGLRYCLDFRFPTSFEPQSPGAFRPVADYLLRYTRDDLIAVVEAKVEYKMPGEGMQQANECAICYSPTTNLPR